MKITRNNIFFGILIFLLLVNLLVLFDLHFLYLRAVFSFIFLTTIPGLLVMLVLKIRKIGFWEYLAYTIGLSVAFLIFFGLTANWVLPLLGVARPLSPTPLLISFDVCLLILWFIACKRNKGISLKIKFPKLDWINQCLLMIPVIFPVLSILGAISLNNSGTNRFTMFMLGGIAVYVLLVVLFRNKLNKNIYPLTIFFISLSLLLMTSLRGWYVTGHDNQEEHFIFQLTKVNHQWDISLYQDPYNACLSISILPTIFSSFLNINDLYIYKIIFQIIFSFSVINIFLFFNKYSARFVAFLSAFYFMSFPVFLNDMPMLNRQEIAFVFFSLMLLVLFNRSLKPRTKEILFFIFGFSMIVSHYSTSYVAVALFVLTYFVAFVLKKLLGSSFTFKLDLRFAFRKMLKTLGVKERMRIGARNYYLTWTMILGIVVLTFLWNTQLTSTSGELAELVSQTLQNINKSFSKDLKSGGVLYSLFSWQKLDMAELFNEYVSLKIEEIELEGDEASYYREDIYERYEIAVLDENRLPLTPLGMKLSDMSLDAFAFNYFLRQGSAKMIQIFILLGFAAFVLGKKNYARKTDPEYKILVLASVVLLALLIVLPLFSIEYGTLRFFQQTLIILSLPLIIGSLVVSNFLVGENGLYISSIIIIVFFLSLSGFIPQITGGYYPMLNLNNQGVYYDSYYTHKSEYDSIKWLADHYSNDYPIQSNLYARSKMLAIGSLYSSKKLLPATIRKDAYVYLDYSNVKNRRNTIFYKGNVISYSYPIEFLDDNKNLLYNNQSSKIFK